LSQFYIIYTIVVGVLSWMAHKEKDVTSNYNTALWNTCFLLSQSQHSAGKYIYNTDR